jgi:CDGSH-type Zn-finger protein
MDTNREEGPGSKMKIIVKKDGPYIVQGNIPLVEKTQVVSEYGEPLTWKKGERIATPEAYSLCRCGKTGKKPFCDGAHRAEHFDGTETADTGSITARESVVPGGKNIVVKFDPSLCMESGFCGNRNATLQQMVLATNDSVVRAQVMAMIERCPSGSLTYSMSEGEANIEPDFPRQVAVTTEITSDGPIDGPLWITGHIPIERADGNALETRNRVTLCNCGLSKNKPLCDGTHRPKDAIQPYSPREVQDRKMGSDK